MKQALWIQAALVSAARRRSVPLSSLPLWCLALALLAGCGGSKSEDSSRVEPPEPTPTAEEPAADDQPPGQLELPSLDLPDPTEPEPGEPGDTAPSGGLEMPSDVTLPDAEQPNADQSSSNQADAAVQITYADWQQIQSQAKSSGRVTVVDLWSLSCEPCLREFPSLVELNEQLGDSVQFMAVNLDFDGRKTRPPEYYEERIKSFLDGVQADSFPQFVSKTPADEVFEAADVVSIPAVLVYDAEGELAHVFVDAGETAGFTYEDDVAPVVRKMAG